MEGDEIGPDIVGEIVTDDSPDMKVLPTNQVIHMDLAREKHQVSGPLCMAVHNCGQVATLDP